MDNIVIVGVGQLGGVFAKGLLRTGHQVSPVNRGDSLEAAAGESLDPALVLVAVGEGDLPPVLDALPDRWRSRVGLLQNELVPRDWERAGVSEPTVAAVWFEKKAGRPIREILPTVIGGPRAPILCAALREVGLRAHPVEGRGALVEALVLKNLYILVSNIAGLRVGGAVGRLWEDHQGLVSAIAGEILDVQVGLLGHEIDRDKLLSGLGEAFLADPDHGCCGRSAPRRLDRMLEHGRTYGIELPTAEQIAAEAGE